MGWGPTQWRHECHCRDPPENGTVLITMHSEMNHYNVSDFISDGKVGDNMTTEAARSIIDEAEEQDGSVIVCNSCGHIKIADKDDGAEPDNRNQEL